MSSQETYARITKQTSRVQLPVPEGARRVLLSISGRWGNPKTDPHPARLEVRSLGGPPHNPNALEFLAKSPDEKASYVRDVRLSITSDTAQALPEGASGVSVEVKRHAPDMELLVRLIPVEDAATMHTKVTNHGDQREHRPSG